METGFEHRKRKHIELALSQAHQAVGLAGWGDVYVPYQSLPEMALSEVSLEPGRFFVCGMTAGHSDAQKINRNIAAACVESGWWFGLGSQRKVFETGVADPSTDFLLQDFPSVTVMGNLGISQLIEAYRARDLSRVFKLFSAVHPKFFCIHLNPLQEAIQPEGTPDFRDGFAALEWIVQYSPLPVVVKETGSGMSVSVLRKLMTLQLFAIDVSGVGGTHWGSIEVERAGGDASVHPFARYGVPTVTALRNAARARVGVRGATPEVWASGGVRDGLHAAKSFCLGAERVGVAEPILRAATDSSEAVLAVMRRFEQELRVALFCAGAQSVGVLSERYAESLRDLA